MPLSPMMQQYMKTKEENPGSLLFYRLGDFYEMFFEDAKIASKELDLVLTGRDCGLDERAPMCGIPYHAVDSYIAKLVHKGYNVAICEQMENPATANGIVKRDIVRICTPGTVTASEMLDESRNNFLCVILQRDGVYGLCFADISTGAVKVCELFGGDTSAKVVNELARFCPTELICTRDTATEKNIHGFLASTDKITTALFDENGDDFEGCITAAREHFGEKSAELGLTALTVGTAALGKAILYLRDVQRGDPENITTVDVYSGARFMSIDATARRNLELCDSRSTGTVKGSLLWVLDATKTSMGKRALRSWVEQPLYSIKDIYLRQNAVSEIFDRTELRETLREELSGINDFERILTRVVLGTCNAKELRTMSVAFRHLPEIKSCLNSVNSKMLRGLWESIDTLTDAADLIDRAIVDDPPFSVREGDMIRKGFNAELDELHEIVTGGKNYLTDIEEREKEKTGIKKLKIGYNRVFGYYIEVTNSFKEMVPESYIRKQTLANAERYITPELKELESKVLGAKERINTLEYELFSAIREQIKGMQYRIKLTADAIARLDALYSLATVAVENDYICPVVDDGDILSIASGRHPVVDKILDGSTPFVPNDTLLDGKDNNLAIITGPNMAGKSTYMRQVALIVIMAQIGSFVPAKSAHIGLVDSVFTRIGASDDLMTGQSTFMTEMNEVSIILKSATSKSLVILDEVGRGTSTFDGMSIAQAVLEFIASKIGAKTLFATHYHELTALEGQLKGIKNYNIAVKKRKDEIIFLRKIVPGPADGSYGTDVAKLAGLPKEVLNRAKTILRELEQIDFGTREVKTASDEDFDDQMTFSQSGKDEIIRDIRMLDPYNISPMEALRILAELKKQAEDIG